MLRAGQVTNSFCEFSDPSIPRFAILPYMFLYLIQLLKLHRIKELSKSHFWILQLLWGICLSVAISEVSKVTLVFLDEQRNESILDTVAKRFTEDKTKALCIPCKKISILSNMGVMAIKISHKRSVKHAKNFNSFNFHHQLASSSQSHFRLCIVHFKNKQKQNQALQQNELYQKLCHVSTLTFSTFQKETTPLGLKQYYGLWIFTMSIFSNSAYRQCYCKKKNIWQHQNKIDQHHFS